MKSQGDRTGVEPSNWVWAVHESCPHIWAMDWSDYRIDLKAPGGIQKNFCWFATTKSTNTLWPYNLTLVKNSEADLFMILRMRLLDSFLANLIANDKQLQYYLLLG